MYPLTGLPSRERTVPEIFESEERERERERGGESESGSCRRVLLRVPENSTRPNPSKTHYERASEGEYKDAVFRYVPDSEKRSGKGGLTTRRRKGANERIAGYEETGEIGETSAERTV